MDRDVVSGSQSFPFILILGAAALVSLSGAGKIRGTPTTAGSSTFTAMVSDASSQSATRGLTLTVASLAANACALYVSPSGSDSNPGTLSSPWQTAQKAFNSASAGQTVCFRGGTYPQYIASTAGYNQVESHSGTPGDPIVFTNYPGEIALLQGSTEIYGSYITVRGTPNDSPNCSATKPCGLIFEGSTGYVLGGVVVCCAAATNPNFVTFDHVEIRKGTFHAGFYEEGCNNAILGSYVHDNGLQDRNEDNGIYWSVTPSGCTNGGLIANNLVEHNYSKGIQVYDGGSATEPAYVTVCGNISVSNGAYGAVIWGDHNVFANNVLYGNGDATQSAQGGLYSGKENLIDRNLTWSTSDHGSKRSGWFVNKGCCLKDNLITDPSFLDPPRHNWDFKPSSPANQWANRDCAKLKEPRVENSVRRSAAGLF